MEKLEKELESVEYSIDEIKTIIEDLKQYDDFEYTIDSLKEALEDLDNIKYEILSEIDEQGAKESREWQNNLSAMNYEFEQSRL